jgi:dipeptidyl aminopeptidase/acylaminoacyl peptidase
MRGILICAVCGWGSIVMESPSAAAEPMTVADLLSFQRVADPQLSPDGRFVVYQVTSVLLDENRTTTALWLATTDGSAPPRQLTQPQGKADRHPRWSPDGKQILFESTRGGTSQIWVLPLEGGEARPLTDLSTGASTGIWSPDGQHIAFVSAVAPQFSELPPAESAAKNKDYAEQQEKNPVKARTFTRLFYRHWDSWVEGKRQHLFVCRADGSECRDVTPGDRDAYPTSTTFSVGDDFTFTPDGKHLIFAAVPAEGEAWSTNYDLCRVNIYHPTTAWETITSVNPAADSSPRFSPDGKQMAWRAQSVPGYEADTWKIVIVDCQPDGSWTGTPREFVDVDEHSADEIAWVDNQRILFTAPEQGAHRVFGIDLTAKPMAASSLAIPPSAISSLSVGGGQLAYQRAAMDQPPEVFLASPLFGQAAASARLKPPRNLSLVNDTRLQKLQLPRPESVSIPVEGGAQMQMWILKPPGFDPSKKWPVAYLVHGGPQSAWDDGWSFRWCPQLWAAQGYVVALPNPRGSTGFGAKFVQEISGDWGGKCYRDLMAGADYLENQPWVDSQRIAAAGASFGGYMMNWFAVNTNRFRCLITHCSVWNFESMWGTTDELWFDEYDHGGLPWQYPDRYREYSPHAKAGQLGEWKTPMLVIHNDLDFRCPIGQGQELFSALQRQGVPSRFVNFPDEGHWVSKPKNSEHWHQECFAWLKHYCPPGPK